MTVDASDVVQNGKSQTSFPKPLQQSGALEQFAYEDNTPVIGREFPRLNVVNDLLNSPNADALIRDLAITSKKTYFLFSIKNTRLTIRIQSRNVASFSSVDKTISRKNSRDTSSLAWEN